MKQLSYKLFMHLLLYISDHCLCLHKDADFFSLFLIGSSTILMEKGREGEIESL